METGDLIRVVLETFMLAEGNMPLRAPKQIGSRVRKVPVNIKNFKGPLSKRHNLANVSQKSVAKKKNTVFDKSVNIQKDLKAINKGKFKKSGENLILKNGRVYTTHNSRIVPVKGPGIHPLNRQEFKTLGVYNSKGVNEVSKKILDNMKVPQEVRIKILEIVKSNKSVIRT